MKRILNGYETVKALGKGCSGQTYLAVQTRLGQNRVIKCSSDTQITKELIKKEADLLKSLSYPSIPIIYDTGTIDGKVFLVEEYCQGESLGSYVSRVKNTDEKEIIELGIRLCETVSYLHELKPAALLYLDFKPEHVILNNNTVKLIDFGASFFKGEDVGNIGATKGFSAPELLAGQMPDERADVFGIGSLLFYMASGGRIFNPEEDFVTQIKNAEWTAQGKLTASIKGALCPNRNSRTLSAEELLGELKKVVSQEGRNTAGSYEIAVVGSGRRTGTSHLAISVTSYLRQIGYDALYFDEQNTGILEKLKNYNNAVKFKHGVYTYMSFKGCPTFGTAISTEEIKADICVRDYGMVTREITDYIYKSDMVFLVCGLREWEMEETLDALASLRMIKDVRLIANNTGREKAAWFSRKIKVKIALFPSDEDPFVLSGAKKHFFESVLGLEGRMIFERKGRFFDKPEGSGGSWWDKFRKRSDIFCTGTGKLPG
ncbi:MAG: serine/threonine protein kinase [Eubacterium sp.]|nr:serine/threonine protein kinase [Eubacterium sp.]